MIRRLHVPFRKPEDLIPHLAKQDAHWKTGYSAKELAVAWGNSQNDFPQVIRQVLATAPEYADAEMIDGFFEREVELKSPGRNSQTDLMIVAGLQNELAIMAIEGKVDEPFAELVRDWNTSPGKQCRLEVLCASLGIFLAQAQSLRFQLLHRAASAIYEAQRYRARHALMLVHSFSAKHRWFEDFATFSCAMGQPLQHPGLCSPAKICEGVSLRLGWAADLCSGV